MYSFAVIGSQGYIGKHLCSYIESRGYKLTRYDIVDIDEPSYTKIDILSKDSIENIDFSADFVFFLSGLTGTYDGFNNYESFIDINEKGLLNFLSSLSKSSFRPKIIFPSTRLVYKGSDCILKEDAEKETKTIYAVNKIACENYLYAYHNSFGINYTVFRICVPYGNFIDDTYSFGTLGFFVNKARNKQPITIYGDGKIRRTFTHIYDLCHLLIQGAIEDKTNNSVYNIGGEDYSLFEVAEFVANTFSGSVELVDWPQKDLLIESGSTVFDDSKIQNVLGGYTYKKLKDDITSFNNKIVE